MITQTMFYKNHKEELAFGLAFGLVFGLAFGLASGLAFGLVSGLVVILVNFSEAFPFISGVQEIILIVLGILILVEIFFWLDGEKKTKRISLTKFTLKKKFEAFCEVLLGLSGIAQIYILSREVQIRNYFPVILRWIGYIGVGILVLGLVILIIYLWVKFNEQKYKR